MKSVVPATSSLLSMLPAFIQGGAESDLPDGGGDAHGAEEGVQRDLNAGGEVGEHLCAIERDDFGAGVGEVVGQEAAAGAKGVAGPGDVDGDFLDAHFEHVAGFGFGERDGGR